MCNNNPLERCGLNDYQNQANNGARSTSMADKIVKGLTRHQAIDKPQIVFLSLIGNDVCNGHIPTENSFTSVQKFHDKTVQTLKHLGKLAKTRRINNDGPDFRYHITARINCDINWFGGWRSSLGASRRTNASVRRIQK